MMRALLVAAVICGCRGWVLPGSVAPFNWVRRGAPPRQPGELHNSRVQGFVLPSRKFSPRSKGLCNAAPSAGDGEGQALQETELTNEQCEILDLPYGTKLVGEMDEFMIERLTKKGTYEGSAGLRYFGNEKFRKKNYFGKQKLQVNQKRSAAKFRRAEIEARMDQGIKYDDAVKQVDAELASGVLDPFGEDTEEGANEASRLPPGWQSAVDKTTGSTYYYNEEGLTQWEPPV